MHLLRFKCKLTGRVFQEEEDVGDSSCSRCAFLWTKIKDERLGVLAAHCVSMPCIPRRTHFVEVTA